MQETQQIKQPFQVTEDRERQELIRALVLQGYEDIGSGRGMECDEFFRELEKKFTICPPIVS